ncbi:MAG: Rmt family 16S rRNA (guanine(1405)-N(7))-methyltransferase [Christensenellales bacterium]|jgi:16S rRNA (guanine(1405)-N(7))-methyltransferase
MMEAALARLRTARKYADVCEDTQRRVLEDAFSRHKKPKDAEKAARETLHAITGAFMSAEELRRARTALDAGDLDGALRMHASTRERMPLADFYAQLFARTGEPARVLDLACGINPLYLGSRGIEVHGIDISGAQAQLVNDWAARTGARASVAVHDLLSDGAIPSDAFDLALAMKLLPVLETQRKGAGARLLRDIRAARTAVTFPTRTLGGRGVGMERHYTQWFESIPRDGWAIEDRYVMQGELIYILKNDRME